LDLRTNSIIDQRAANNLLSQRAADNKLSRRTVGRVGSQFASVASGACIGKDFPTGRSSEVVWDLRRVWGQGFRQIQRVRGCFSRGLHWGGRLASPNVPFPRPASVVEFPGSNLPPVWYAVIAASVWFGFLPQRTQSLQGKLVLEAAYFVYQTPDGGVDQLLSGRRSAAHLVLGKTRL
jgi:hypothetical protein